VPKKEPLIQKWRATYRVGQSGQDKEADALLVNDLGWGVAVGISGEGKTVHLQIPPESVRNLVERLMLVGGFHVPLDEDRANIRVLIQALTDYHERLLALWTSSRDAALEELLVRVEAMLAHYRKSLGELT
jgi:hypothetical protein